MTTADHDVAPDPGPTGGDPEPLSRTHDQVVGDRALAVSTGRSRADWYALLDAAGASGWPHREIASWLVREHGVDGWWAQGITVGYEQTRGIRVPGQRQDGLFECSVSRTLPVDHERAWDHVADDVARAAWLDVPVEVTGTTPPASVRWRLPDGTRAVVRVEPVRPGATRVVVQHARLPDAEALTASKTAWKQRLATLAQSATAG
jgi:hypothetical protein